jgi:conjugal transfer pilus assembly protein TraK
MFYPVKPVWALLKLARWLASFAGVVGVAGVVGTPTAHALQVVEATDGVTVEAVLSIKEPTRIRIDGAAITNVFGNIYSSNCGTPITSQSGPAQPGSTPTAIGPQINPAGEIVLECDLDKGEIYVRPVGGVGNTGKPVNLFISSQHGTYTLLLRRSDTPADTIVVRDRSARAARPEVSAGRSAGQQAQHVRALKALLVAMASDRVPTDIRVDEVDRPLQLWLEARFALVRLYEGRGLIGERYVLTNIGQQNMVLAEQEFDRESGAVLAVSIETHNLRPGESTAVYVIRQGA